MESREAKKYCKIRTNDKLPQFSCTTTAIQRSSDGMTFKIKLYYFFFLSLSVSFWTSLCFVFAAYCYRIYFQCEFDLNRPAAINCCCCLLPQMRTNARLNFEHNLLNLITITYVFTQPQRALASNLTILCSLLAPLTIRSSGAQIHSETEKCFE